MRMNIFTKEVLSSKLGVLGLLLSLFIFSSLALNAQTSPIKGKVLDEKGQPLMGATVLVVGTSNGGMADLDGNFMVKLPKGKTMLQVSFMGYQTKKVQAKNGMVIKLRPDNQFLKAVVVTGLVAQDKRLFSGASDKLKADKVKMSGMPDISRGLEGRSAGVSVQNVSGTFGSAPKIRIRGATSINGSSSPLWVVDGVIQEGVSPISADGLASGDATTLISSAISGLNADDIESFQILKDGSATSIYGAKAMAGVIVVTTKKGREGSSSVSYTGEFTYRLKPSYNDFNIMNSQDQIGFYRELEKKGYLNFSEVLRNSTSGVYGKMYQLIHTYDKKTGQFGLANTDEARREYLNNAGMRNTDWFDELFRTGLIQNHSVSFNSGTKKSRTYASISAMLDPGWTASDKVRRYTANVNNTYNFSPKVSLTSIARVSYREQHMPGTEDRRSNEVEGGGSREFDINPYSYALHTSRTLDPSEYYQNTYAPFNIKHELKNNFMELEEFDTRFQAELKWKPFSELTIRALGAMQYTLASYEHRVSEFSNKAKAYRAMGDHITIRNNDKLYTDPDHPNDEPVTILPKGGFFNTNAYKKKDYSFTASASYNTEFEGGHILNAFAAFEMKSIDRSENGFDGWGMQYDAGELAFFDYRAFKQLNEENGEYYYLDQGADRTNALAGMLTYSYKRRYNVTGTMRYDGSNKLGRSMQARWLPTWNISGSWNAHEEDFFQNYLSKAMTRLVLRGSYSLAGNTGPARNTLTIIRGYNPWRPAEGERESANIITDYENEDLTFEKKHEFNFGLEAGFLKDRLSMSLDVYRRDNFDLIGAIETRLGTRIGNVASMNSSGVELSLSSTNIKTKQFSWTTDFVFAYARNEVTSFKTKEKMLKYLEGSNKSREGYPAGALFSIPFEGLDEIGMPKFKIQDEIVDRNSYHKINFQEREKLDFLKYEGPINPTFFGSLGNTFRVGDFSLNVFVTYSGGNKLRLPNLFTRQMYTDYSAISREIDNRWMVPGDENRTVVPAIPSERQNRMFGSSNVRTAYNAFNYSTERVADGGFVRLKEVSLRYTLPKNYLESLKFVKRASMKLQGTNLLLLYADKKLNGRDPEFMASGGVAMPLPKQFTFTLSLGF